jgi:hypothetical protein
MNNLLPNKRAKMKFKVAYAFYLIVVSSKRISFSQKEDMGLFMTVSGFLNNNYKLYVEVYDMKDPLFFEFSSFISQFLGIKGFFLQDFIWLIIFAGSTYGIYKKLKFESIPIVISLFILPLIFFGQYFQAFRTQSAAISLLFLSVYLMLKTWYKSAGFVLATMIFFKLTFILFIPIFFIYILIFEKKRVLFLLNLGISLFLSSFSYLLYLQVSGSLFAYFDMVLENITYANNYSRVVGLPSGLLGHLERWNYFEPFSNYIFIITFIIVIFLSKRLQISDLRENRIKVFLFSALALSTFSYIFFTMLWPHHLQILVNFYVFFIPIYVSFSIKMVKSFSKPLSRLLISTLLSLIFLMNIFVSGFDLSLQGRMPIKDFFKYEWKIPPEVVELNDLKYSHLVSKQVKVARLGSLDDLGYGSFINNDRFEFVCTRTSIGGIESKKTIESFIACIESKPDVLTYGPMLFGLSRINGDYNLYRETIRGILESNWICKYPLKPNYNICIKRSS